MIVPNSIDNADDGRARKARLTMMKALLPHFLNRELRGGPFFYRLTDLHPSNMFLDSQWEVKFIIDDLEWACSLPAETFRPLYWLTSRAIDGLTDENGNLEIDFDTCAQRVRGYLRGGETAPSNRQCFL